MEWRQQSQGCFFDRYVMAEVVVFLSFTLVGMFCFSKVWKYGGIYDFCEKDGQPERFF